VKIITPLQFNKLYSKVEALYHASENNPGQEFIMPAGDYRKIDKKYINRLSLFSCIGFPSNEETSIIIRFKFQDIIAGDHFQIPPGSTISGDCVFGDGATIGARTVFNEDARCTFGKHATFRKYVKAPVGSALVFGKEVIISSGCDLQGESTFSEGVTIHAGAKLSNANIHRKILAKEEVIIKDSTFHLSPISTGIRFYEGCQIHNSTINYLPKLETKLLINNCIVKSGYLGSFTELRDCTIDGEITFRGRIHNLQRTEETFYYSTLTKGKTQYVIPEYGLPFTRMETDRGNLIFIKDRYMQESEYMEVLAHQAYHKMPWIRTEEFTCQNANRQD